MQSVIPIVQTVADHLVPEPFKSCLRSGLRYIYYLSWSNNNLTAKIEEYDGAQKNEMFEAAKRYLRDKIDPSTKCFKVHKTHRQKELSVSIDNNIVIADTFEELDVTWTLRINEDKRDSKRDSKRDRLFFELSFDKKFYDRVLNNYLPFIVDRVREIRNTEKIVKLSCRGYDKGYNIVDMDHPATFDTLVMDPDMKEKLIDDLDTFTKRENYYRRTGRAWKRGYLLYGPPGTGKSSLVAAMANYLKYDVHELELTSLDSNTDFQRTLLSTGNRSIIVIEDIDCSAEEVQVLNPRRPTKLPSETDTRWTLSGLLNFLDGLWSSCGDERIFVFTTNHKDRLDPALFRPGRIDMEILMSYITMDGFRLLAHNYLGINGSHGLFNEIEDLITEVNVTPAEVSGELMRNENVDIALEGLVNFIKGKKEEQIPTATPRRGRRRNGPESQQAKKRRTTKTKEEIREL